MFEKSKNAFIDNSDCINYIQVDNSSKLYQSFKEALSKPIKMLLLYGKPGTGKSIFLSKLCSDLEKENKIFLYKTPILDESEFYKLISQDLFNIKYEGELNFTQFMKIIENNHLKKSVILLLDEAQLYSETLVEKIRLISDTRSIKFVLCLHKTHKEDLLAKEHFKTRIWDSVELVNVSKEELKLYIQKKLVNAGCLESLHMFNKNSTNLIYKLTKGNYRNTNKLLYTVFNIYEIYAQNKNKMNYNRLSNKIIEMSAINTGLINA